MTDSLRKTLVSLADKYETAAFLRDDPSQFMHRYALPSERERAAFVASALSYGSRTQFIPKIDTLLNIYMGGGKRLPSDDKCFYRLHTNRMVNRFLDALDTIYRDFGSMKAFVSAHDIHTGIGAVRLLCGYFSSLGASELVPKNPQSACKRVCMFLRWMVRNNSPVDIGLWSGVIDKATLIVPLDTHVLQEARKAGLISSRSASMSTAVKLTERLKEAFPTDPLRGDFALFGLGTDADGERKNGFLTLNIS